MDVLLKSSSKTGETTVQSYALTPPFARKNPFSPLRGDVQLIAVHPKSSDVCTGSSPGRSSVSPGASVNDSVPSTHWLDVKWHRAYWRYFSLNFSRLIVASSTSAARSSLISLGLTRLPRHDVAEL